MAIIQSWKITYFGEEVKRVKCLHIVNRNGIATVENSLVVPQENKHNYQMTQRFIYMGIYYILCNYIIIYIKRSGTQAYMSILIIRAALFTMAKRWEQL